MMHTPRGVHVQVSNVVAQKWNNFGVLVYKVCNMEEFYDAVDWPWEERKLMRTNRILRSRDRALTVSEIEWKLRKIKCNGNVEN